MSILLIIVLGWIVWGIGFHTGAYAMRRHLQPKWRLFRKCLTDDPES